MKKIFLKKSKLYILFLIILFGFLYLAFFNNNLQADIDRCLDHGQAWDYKNNICSDDCQNHNRVWSNKKKICELK